jgi:hypothetical protein
VPGDVNDQDDRAAEAKVVFRVDLAEIFTQCDRVKGENVLFFNRVRGALLNAEVTTDVKTALKETLLFLKPHFQDDTGTCDEGESIRSTLTGMGVVIDLRLDGGEVDET